MGKQRINKKELNALIHLLDDPDEIIYSEIKNKFVSLGPPAIPHLESAWENTYDIIMQKRIEQIIHHIQFSKLKAELENWGRISTAIALVLK